MIYTELQSFLKQGKIGKLPNFEGYFKWDFGLEKPIFFNKEFRCLADDLDIKNREDFYYII